MMKRHIFLCIGIILLGIVAIVLPRFLSGYYKDKEINEIKIQLERKEQNNKILGSSKDTVEQMEIPFGELESEQFDENQVFFKNIDELYMYFTFNQVDQVKNKVQFYLLQNLNNIKECNIIRESIKNNSLEFSFQISVNNYNNITVIVNMDEKKQITDIKLLQSL